MMYGLDEAIIQKMIEVAKEFKEIECVKIFGSRVRGDHRTLSDIDLAIFGENIDKGSFTYLIETKVPTLLEFDFSYMDEIEDKVFEEQIQKEGVVIYEKY